MNTRRANAPRIVILAAGHSVRLGRPKALAKVRGVGLLARTVAVLRPCTALPIIVVVPERSPSYRGSLGPRDARFVVNAGRARGQSSSVLRGLRAARHSPAVLLVPVDLAQLERRDVVRLIDRWRAGRRRVAARRVAARRTAGMAGTPLILPHRFMGVGAELRGDQGLREFVRSLPADQVTLVPMASAAADVDTPADLARVRRRLCTGRVAGQARAACTRR